MDKDGITDRFSDSIYCDSVCNVWHLFYSDFRSLQGQDRANFLKKLKKNHAAFKAINNGVYFLMINSILQCVIGINLRFGNGDNIPLTIFQGRDPRIKLTSYWKLRSRASIAEAPCALSEFLFVDPNQVLLIWYNFFVALDFTESVRKFFDRMQ